MPIEFEDYSLQVSEAIDDAAIAFLHEAAAEIQAQTQRNTPVDSGQLKGSFSSVVDEGAKEAKVGSPLENAIWTEFGTGEHALEGNGRKGGWYYVDDKGEGHFTHGKKPSRMMWNAFESKKAAIIRRAEQIFKGLG